MKLAIASSSYSRAVSVKLQLLHGLSPTPCLETPPSRTIHVHSGCSSTAPTGRCYGHARHWQILPATTASPYHLDWDGWIAQKHIGAKCHTWGTFNGMVKDQEYVRIPYDSRRQHYGVAEFPRLPHLQSRKVSECGQEDEANLRRLVPAQGFFQS